MKLPLMPLWVADIKTDRFCRRLTDAEFGRYMRLIISQWIEGDVPADPAEAIWDAGMDQDAVESVRKLLELKFPAVGNSRQNQRVADERERALAKVETNRKNGALGGRPKKANGKPTPETERFLRASDSVLNSDSSLPEGESEGKPKPPTVKSKDVEAIYAAYPKKVAPREAKRAIERAVRRLSREGRENPAEYLLERTTAYAGSTYVSTVERKFIPGPAPWFNQGHYDDDPAEWDRDASASKPRKENAIDRLLRE